MRKNRAFVCVFPIKHAHAFIMAKDVSLSVYVCMCVQTDLSVCILASRKKRCVCARVCTKGSVCAFKHLEKFVSLCVCVCSSIAGKIMCE